MLVFEKDSVQDSFCSGCFDENRAASVVVQGCLKVPSVAWMLTPYFTSVWFDMELYSTDHGSKWHAIVVEVPVVVCVCWDVGCYVQLLYEIQGKYYLRYQFVPLVDWEVVLNACHGCNEVAFVCLYTAFGDVCQCISAGVFLIWQPFSWIVLGILRTTYSIVTRTVENVCATVGKDSFRGQFSQVQSLRK